MDRMEDQEPSSTVPESESPDTKPPCACVKLSDYIKSNYPEIQVIGLLMCVHCGVNMQHVSST